jgi:hypothetical protein
MTFTYDETALSGELNRIRLELGDTDSDKPILQNEEIEQVISEEGGFHHQVAVCARIICSFFSNGPSKYKIEGYFEDNSKAYDRFKKIACYHEGMGSSGPWAGSILDSWKDSNRLDTSLVAPKFKKGMHDYPGT